MWGDTISSEINFWVNLLLPWKHVSHIFNPSTSCFAQLCLSPKFPCTGKANRVGVSAEDHDLILSSSSQQSIKPFKGSSQIVMVTRPAAASSADSHHISLVVRTETFWWFWEPNIWFKTNQNIYSDKNIVTCVNIIVLFSSAFINFFKFIFVPELT